MLDVTVAASIPSATEALEVSPPSADAFRSFSGMPGLAADLQALQHLDLYELRVRWRKLTRRAAPEHLWRSLLLRMLAYKLQARVLGDLDQDSARFLASIVKERARRMRRGERRKAKQ